MAKAAGVEFIPATKLRQLYPDAVSSSSLTSNEPATDGKSFTVDETGSKTCEGPAAVNKTCVAIGDEAEADDSILTKRGENVPVVIQPSIGQKGTEVSLMGLQLTDGAVTLVTCRLSLIVACARCTNTVDMQVVPGQVYRAECSYCHNSLLVELTATIVHQMSSVVGWLNLEGCRAFDLVLTDCQFAVGCINCSKEEKINVSVNRATFAFKLN